MTSLLARIPNQEVHAATTLQQIEVCCCTGTVVLIYYMVSAHGVLINAYQPQECKCGFGVLCSSAY